MMSCGPHKARRGVGPGGGGSQRGSWPGCFDEVEGLSPGETQQETEEAKQEQENRHLMGTASGWTKTRVCPGSEGLQGGGGQGT